MAARKTKNAKKKAEEAVEVQNNPILIPQAQSEQDEQTSIQQEIQEEPVEQMTEDGMHVGDHDALEELSGVIGLLADEKGSGKEIAEAVMAELGISSVKELETVDYRLFAKAYLKLRPAFQKAGKYVGCRPHPNAFYLGDPSKVGFRKETQHVPLLVCSVFSEFFSCTPAPYDPAAMPEA